MIEPTLLDTDTMSEILKGRDPQVDRRKSEYLAVHHRLTFTSATVMETLHGLYRKDAVAQARVAEEAFAMNIEIAPTPSDYRLAGRILGALSLRGTPIGVIDPLIAACALNRNLILATGNLRHFGFVAAAGFPLRLEDWRT